ncbi:MAG: sulfite exporter TauE/SafE family protein [Alphaproteobacteria bacterium]|nr:sulfite exporter TauE/SafE family protein [Alphaproteobacteria bacterium]
MTLFGWAGLAGTTFAAALLQAVSGFGFAVLAVPLYLLFVDPAKAVQLVIVLSTALSFAVVPGLRRTIAPALLLRLIAGSLAGLPIGLFSFRYADRLLVRLGVGVTILAFAVMMAAFRRRGGRPWTPFGRTQPRDLAAGAVAGVATALVGMAGPPVLIYLLLTGTAAQTVRATLLAFFALSYGATLASHAATIGIPGPTWAAAAILAPFALFGGLVGRPIGDRLGSDGFAILAIALLTAAGLYTAAAAGVELATRQP